MKKTKTFFDKLPKTIKDRVINFFNEDNESNDLAFKNPLIEILRSTFKQPNEIIVFLKHYKLFDKEMEEAIFPFIFAEKDHNEKV